MLSWAPFHSSSSKIFWPSWLERDGHAVGVKMRLEFSTGLYRKYTVGSPRGTLWYLVNKGIMWHYQSAIKIWGVLRFVGLFLESTPWRSDVQFPFCTYNSSSKHSCCRLFSSGSCKHKKYGPPELLAVSCDHDNVWGVIELLLVQDCRVSLFLQLLPPASRHQKRSSVFSSGIVGSFSRAPKWSLALLLSFERVHHLKRFHQSWFSWWETEVKVFQRLKPCVTCW